MKFCHLIRGCRHYGDVKYGNPLSHQKWKISTLFVTSWKQPWTAVILGYWLKYILERILSLIGSVLLRKDIYRIGGSCFPRKNIGNPPAAASLLHFFKMRASTSSASIRPSSILQGMMTFPNPPNSPRFKAYHSKQEADNELWNWIKILVPFSFVPTQCLCCNNAGRKYELSCNPSKIKYI